MDANKPRHVDLNHVALDVGDVEDALHFYGRLFAFGRLVDCGDAGRVCNHVVEGFNRHARSSALMES